MEDILGSLLKPDTFAMALCAYLLIRFESTLKDLKSSIDKQGKAMMYMASKVNSEEAMAEFLKNGGSNAEKTLKP